MSICSVIAQYAGHLFFGLGVVTVQRVQVDQRDLRKINRTGFRGICANDLGWSGVFDHVFRFIAKASGDRAAPRTRINRPGDPVQCSGESLIVL